MYSVCAYSICVCTDDGSDKILASLARRGNCLPSERHVQEYRPGLQSCGDVILGLPLLDFCRNSHKQRRGLLSFLSSFKSGFGYHTPSDRGWTKRTGTTGRLGWIPAQAGVWRARLLEIARFDQLERRRPPVAHLHLHLTMSPKTPLPSSMSPSRRLSAMSYLVLAPDTKRPRP
jgi:hypothetical protein